MVPGTFVLYGRLSSINLHDSQVAVDRTYPNGRVVGIDIIPAQPPAGVSTIQGNFLSQAVRDEVKKFLYESSRGRVRQQGSLVAADEGDPVTREELEDSPRGYFESEKRADLQSPSQSRFEARAGRLTKKGKDEAEGRMVDIVLSDMSAPWEQTAGFWKRSLSDPYYRMMNTSGMNFRDHAGSMVRSKLMQTFGGVTT